VGLRGKIVSHRKDQPMGLAVMREGEEMRQRCCHAGRAVVPLGLGW